jgi:hypothetical protein
MTLTKDKIYKNTKDKEAKRFSSFGFYFYLLKNNVIKIPVYL